MKKEDVIKLLSDFKASEVKSFVVYLEEKEIEWKYNMPMGALLALSTCATAYVKRDVLSKKEEDYIVTTISDMLKEIYDTAVRFGDKHEEVQDMFPDLFNKG